MDFFIKNWKVIAIGLLGLTIGFLLNVYANSKSEQKIIDALTAEIESIKNKRITAQEQTRLIQLQAQLDLLKNK